MNNAIERFDIPIGSLRLWSGNPRYSLEPTIRIDRIGEDDFTLNDFFIEKDNYLLNYEDYVERLLINKDSISKTRDLIESLKNGYDQSKDQMFVVRPRFLDTYSVGDDIPENIYYVVEGNRRLVCLDLILNNNNSRNVIENLISIKSKSIMKNEIDPSYKNQILEQISNLREILEIAKSAEKYFPDVMIPCEVLNFSYYTSKDGIKKLNEMLNAKHFGERKGKLNWPRGLILAKIFGKIEEFKRQKGNVKIDEKMVIDELNDYMGKVVTRNDIQAALLLYRSVTIWDKRNPDNRLKFQNTEEGDVQYWVSDISFDQDGNEIKDMTLNFSASALELAKNNIRIYDKNYKLVVLNKIIQYKYDVNEILNFDSYMWIEDKEKNNIRIPNEAAEEIFYIVIKGVIEHKVTTRSIKDDSEGEVGEKIRKILNSPIDNLSPKKMIDLSFETIESISKTITEDQKAYDLVKNLSELVNTDEIFNESALKDEDNIFSKTIYYIWKNEFGRIAKFKKKTTLKELPLMVVSLLYRETFEFIVSFFHFSLTLNYWKSYDPISKKSTRFKEKSDVSNIANIVTKQVIESKILKLDGKTIDNENEFIDILKKENNSNINLENIYSDLRYCFLILIGYTNTLLDTDDYIDFKYFEKIKLKDSIQQIINSYPRKNYNASDFLGAKHDFYRKEESIKLANELNCFDFSEAEKFEKNEIIFKFLRKYDNTNDYRFHINRLIHKPLFALSIYELTEENAWYEAMNSFVSFLIETTRSLINLCTK